MQPDDLVSVSVGGDGTGMTPAMDLALQASFGSAARWRDSFSALAAAHGGTPGWVVLSFQPHQGTLANAWMAHGTQPPADSMPLLALDAVRVSALIDSIRWDSAYERYQHAVHEASTAFGAGLDELAGATLIDVRRAGVFRAAGSRIPGSQWRDPAAVSDWAGGLRRDQALVVYCVYGHEVGHVTALRLRAEGLPARFLLGGIDAWQLAGRPLEPKEATP
jgi:superoxide dismutase, Fe-Mn family